MHGEGEWKVRRYGRSQYSKWRKFHVTVELASGEVQAAVLSDANGADGKMVEPM